MYFNGSQARLTVGLSLRKKMRETFRRGRYDLVHVHSPLSPSLPLLAIDEADCPVVGTFHTYFERSYLYGITRQYLQNKLDKMAAAIAVSHSTTVALNRYFEANWTIVPNGIDLRPFQSARAASPWNSPRRARNSLPGAIRSTERPDHADRIIQEGAKPP